MNYLKMLRETHKLSTTDLANRIGVSQSAIVKWETGAKSIPLKRKEELARLFGVDVLMFDRVADIEVLPAKDSLFNKAHRMREELPNKVEAYLSGNDEYSISEESLHILHYGTLLNRFIKITEQTNTLQVVLRVLRSLELYAGINTDDWSELFQPDPKSNERITFNNDDDLVKKILEIIKEGLPFEQHSN